MLRQNLDLNASRLVTDVNLDVLGTTAGIADRLTIATPGTSPVSPHSEPYCPQYEPGKQPVAITKPVATRRVRQTVLPAFMPLRQRSARLWHPGMVSGFRI